MSFPETTDENFERILMNILDLSTKDNTYKYAFARFLLEYSTEHSQTHVSFSKIAESFLKYYWPLECKFKLRQSPHPETKPEIIKIIQDEFGTGYYPQSFDEIRKEDPEKIKKSIEQIKRKCFHNVTWRFQKVKYGKNNKEYKVFFDYKLKKIWRKNKSVDLDFGIYLNPQAMAFFKKYNVTLNKSVNLEWARFLGKLNLSVPKLIEKTEGKLPQRTGLTKYRIALSPFFKECFFCKNTLKPGKDTHVDHFIPFDYIAEDNIWNFNLACQKCNCEKLGSLPPKIYLDKLIDYNKDYRKKIPLLKKSLAILGPDFEKIIRDHYENAKSHGYMVLENFPSY